MSRWKYVDDNNVQLPDEYDFLHRNLEIFWGVSPSILEQRRSEWATSPGTFSIGKAQLPHDARITSLNPQLSGDVANVNWRASLQLVEFN
jgi:hypothetical protein